MSDHSNVVAEKSIVEVDVLPVTPDIGIANIYFRRSDRNYFLPVANLDGSTPAQASLTLYTHATNERGLVITTKRAYGHAGAAGNDIVVDVHQDNSAALSVTFEHTTPPRLTITTVRVTTAANIKALVDVIYVPGTENEDTPTPLFTTGYIGSEPGTNRVLREPYTGTFTGGVDDYDLVQLPKDDDGTVYTPKVLRNAMDLMDGMAYIHDDDDITNGKGIVPDRHIVKGEGIEIAAVGTAATNHRGFLLQPGLHFISITAVPKSSANMDINMRSDTTAPDTDAKMLTVGTSQISHTTNSGGNNVTTMMQVTTPTYIWATIGGETAENTTMYVHKLS